MRVTKVYKVDEHANKAASQGKEMRHYNKNLIPTKRKVYIILVIMEIVNMGDAKNGCFYFGKCIDDTLQYEIKQYLLLIFQIQGNHVL